MYKLEPLDFRKRKIKQIKGIPVKVLTSPELADLLFVVIDSTKHIDSKNFNGLVDQILEIGKKVNRQVILMPDNVKFLKAVEMDKGE